MKALSIRQPWANLIASGTKTMETRTWATSYRGELLIVSSKYPRISPAGCALAVVDLVECRPMTLADEKFAHCEVYEHAIVWIFRNIRPISPVPVRGKLGLFEPDINMATMIRSTVPEDRIQHLFLFAAGSSVSRQ
jgi:ASCH domain